MVFSRIRKPAAEQVAHGKKQQRDRSEALLPVYDVVVGACAVALDSADNAAEEVARAVLPYNFYEVIVELPTMLLLPVIAALVNRYDKAVSLALHKVHQPGLGTLHALNPQNSAILYLL